MEWPCGFGGTSCRRTARCATQTIPSSGEGRGVQRAKASKGSRKTWGSYGDRPGPKSVHLRRSSCHMLAWYSRGDRGPTETQMDDAARFSAYGPFFRCTQSTPDCHRLEQKKRAPATAGKHARNAHKVFVSAKCIKLPPGELLHAQVPSLCKCRRQRHR